MRRKERQPGGSGRGLYCEKSRISLSQKTLARPDKHSISTFSCRFSVGLCRVSVGFVSAVSEKTGISAGCVGSIKTFVRSGDGYEVD